MNTAYKPLKKNAIYDDSVRGFGRDTLVRNRSTSRLGDIKSGTNYGHDATGKVTIGTPNDKVVDSQHQSTKPHKVQAKDIPKTKDPKEQQQNTCEVQKDIASAGTVLDQTQGNNSRGMADLQDGANRKASKQNSNKLKRQKGPSLKKMNRRSNLNLLAH